MTREEAVKILQNIYFEVPEIKEALQVAIDALSNPSLSSNLDEAAEKSGLEYAPIISGEALDSSGQFYETDDIDWPSRCGFIKGFKAGAKWMAEQGITFEGKASRRYENGLAGFVSWILFDQQKAVNLLVNQGEEADVIINIRKKQQPGESPKKKEDENTI